MANVLGRGVIKIGEDNTYKAVKKLYVKKGPEWKNAKTAWVKQNGVWVQVYPTPQAESSFSPTTLSFETYNGSQSNVQYVSITNTGTENLIIEEFTTTYTAFGKFVEFFDLTELGGTLPATIAPGETKRLGIGIDGGEVGSSDATIRIKTNVGALGTEYKEYPIYGNVIPPFADVDVWPKLDYTLEYFRYQPRQTRQEVKITNIGNGSLIITGIEYETQYFNIISYPDAIAPQRSGNIVIESRATETLSPGVYTDVIIVKSNSISGDVQLVMTLDYEFPEGSVKLSNGGAGEWIVPDNVYRLSEVRVIGGGGGGGQGFNQQITSRVPNPNVGIVVDYSITGNGIISTNSGGTGSSTSGSIKVSQGDIVTIIIRPGNLNKIVITYQNANQVGRGGSVTSYTSDGLTYWVHTFASSGDSLTWV